MPGSRAVRKYKIKRAELTSTTIAGANSGTSCVRNWRDAATLFAYQADRTYQTKVGRLASRSTGHADREAEV